MKKGLLLGAAGAVALSLLSAGGDLSAEARAKADAKADLKAACQKLGGESYAWVSTPKSEGAGGGQGGRFQAGPTEGKTEKDGYTCISTKAGENTLEAALKGGKAAVKTAEGWKAPADFGQGGQGRRDPAASFARGLANFKAPAASAEALADALREVKDEGEGVYSGDLTEEGVKAQLAFGGRPGGQAPSIAEPKGTAKFWVKEGQLVKFEYNVQGKMTFGQREVAINRTTTVEIKDIGSAKVELPEEAKAKLQ
jgi:hypothetical protein